MINARLSRRISSMNRTFGLLAAVGLVLAVTAHALTFYPGPSIVTEEWSPVWLLQPGMFIAFAAMILSMVQEHRSRPGRADPRSLFPRWARILLTGATIYALYNFSQVHFGDGTAESRNGGFVLVSRGSIIRTLSEDEYLATRRAAVRGPSGHWILFYLSPALYFLFGRRPQSNPSAGTR
jgi:hypothetical protein